jgi:cytochrome P450
VGKSESWESDSSEKPAPGFRMSYIQSVKIIIDQIAGGILIPKWILHNYPRFLPGYTMFKELGYAMDEFPIHTEGLLEDERQRAKQNEGTTRSNIMSQMLEASEAAQNEDSKVKDGRKSKALSDEEIIGNLFVFTAAGFDSTANTVAYTLVLLARHEEWQQWVLEEVDQIVPRDATADFDYAAMFPKVTRLLAFMFETLRLFVPLIHLSKQNPKTETITTSKGTYVLPANCTLYINCVALHLDPDVWRNLNLQEGETARDDDEHLFRPTRWLNPPGSAQTLYQPPKGAYLPWSASQRVCPGQKMAQVEFVAIFLTLLKDYQVEAAMVDGESKEASVENLEKRMQDSISLLTLQMRDVYDITETDPAGLKLRFSKRN